MNINTNQFKPTFIQKILGKNYKWWYFLYYYFQRSLVYKNTYFAMVFRYLVPVGILLTVFYSTGSSKPAEYYLIATLIFYIFTLPMTISYEMKDGVLFGKYTRLLLLPTDLHLYLLFQSVGVMLVPFFIRVVLFAAIFWFFNIHILFTFTTAMALLFAIVFGVLISFCIEIIIGSTSFILPDNKFLLQGFQDLAQLLTGGVLPLTGFLSPLSYLPFAFAVHHPMQIYLGNYTINDALIVFFGGLGWVILLFAFAKFIFNFGLKYIKYNEAVGL
jgi:ABC-type uncharacterized transport system permease subunit